MAKSAAAGAAAGDAHPAAAGASPLSGAEVLPEESGEEAKKVHQAPVIPPNNPLGSFSDAAAVFLRCAFLRCLMPVRVQQWGERRVREETSKLLASATTYVGPSTTPLDAGAAVSGGGRGSGRYREVEGREGDGSAGAAGTAGDGPQPAGKESAGDKRGQGTDSALAATVASAATDVLRRRGWGERGYVEGGRWLRLLVLASQQLLLRQLASRMLIEMVSGEPLLWALRQTHNGLMLQLVL